MINALYLVLIGSFAAQAAVIVTSSSSDVRIESINGNTTIYLNDRLVDLTKAKVINETNETKILEPAESDEYIIVVDKRTDQVIGVGSKDSGRIIQTILTPEQEEKFMREFQTRFSESMQDFRRSMQDMANSLGSMWNW